MQQQFDHDLLESELLKYQYSGTKPNEGLRNLLRTLPHENNLAKIIANFDSLKVKRLLKYTSRKDIRVLIQHKIEESILDEDTLSDAELISFFEKKRTAPQEIRDRILNRLKEEFLIDVKSRTSCFQFRNAFLKFLSPQDIHEILLTALRLIKRSENNIETLHTILRELRIFDTSGVVEEIQLVLQDYLKNDLSLKCLKLVIQNTQSEAQLKRSIQFIDKLITSTHDEAKKYAFYQLVPSKVEISAEIYKITLSIASIINTETQVFELYRLISPLNIPLTDFPTLKKLCLGNKFSSSFVQLIACDTLERLKADAATDDFNSLMVIVQQNLNANFKNFAKVVTQPLMFQSGLKCALLYLLFCEENGPANLVIKLLEDINKNAGIFDSKSHLVQVKYLSILEEPELYVQCLLYHYAFTYAGEYEPQRLLPLLTLTSFSKKKTWRWSAILPLFELFTQREDAVQLPVFWENLMRTAYYFLYQVEVTQDFRKDRLNQFFRNVNPHLKNLQLPLEAYQALSHSLLSQKLISSLKPHQIEIDFNSFFTQNALLSYNPYTPQSYVNLFAFFRDFIDLDKIKQFLDPNNLNKAINIDDEALPQVVNLDPVDLINSGLTVVSNKPPVNKEEVQLQQELLKLQNKKVMMMDENEVKQQNIRRHKERMLFYYTHCLVLFTNFIKGESKNNFFINHFDALSQFCSEAEFRLPFLRFALKYFRSDPLTQQYEWPLTMFFILKAQNLTDDKINKKINEFQEKILKQQIRPDLLKIIHLMNLYIIRQRSFDIQTKTKTFQFVIEKGANADYLNQFYEPFIQNINICAHAKNSSQFLKLIIQNQEQSVYLFHDILNYVYEAQMLTLRTITEIPNDFDILLKLHILTSQEEITERPVLPALDVSQLSKWNLEKFIAKHSREHVEEMIAFLAKYPVDDSFPELMHSAASHLLKALQDDQLEFFPYFVNIFLDRIPRQSLAKMVDLLILFAADESKQHIVEVSRESGIALIRGRGKEATKEILQVIEAHISKKINSLCALIFLGVLSPYLEGQNQRKIQEQILNLFNVSPQQTQLNLAKCLPDLLSFFPDAVNTIDLLLKTNKNQKEENIRRGNSYLVAGLLKGLGIQSIESMRILERLDESQGGKKEPQQEKEAVLFQVKALVEIFGRLLEPYVLKTMGVLMKYFGDGKQEIRDIAISAARTIMQNMTGYGVKIMLPDLLQGLDEDTQWRGKVANIWALGNMAYCSPKQLSSRLPLIVNSISKAIADTHPQVRSSANESLNQIGSTIKNPEISSICDILILALSNPYDQNSKGLEVILQTKFQHYIDAPAMSLLIPIIDYAFRSSESKQKMQGAILIGTLPLLIARPEDLVPYMDLIVGGLEVVIGDPLVEVRSIAAKAIGQLSKKIGIENTRIYFRFIWDILENKEANTIKRSGAAHSLAEIVCIHGQEYYEKQMIQIFESIQRPEVHIKEGYIGTFIFIPSIMQDQFQIYVKDVIEQIYEYVSHDEEVIANITLRVIKIIIKNYGVIQNELLYPALTEAMLNEDYRKRSAGTILSGEMLKLALKIVKVQYEKPHTPQYINIELYNQNLMMLYVMQQDIADSVRSNAVLIWKEYIENTPKTVKRGIRFLTRHLCDMMNKIELKQNSINTISNFCQKYGEAQIVELLNHLNLIFAESDNLSLVKGGYAVLTQMYRYTDNEVLLKYRDLLIELSRRHITSHDQKLKVELFDSVGVMINRVKNTSFVEQLIEPYLEALLTMNEEDTLYAPYLDIFNQLCSLNSPLILHYLVILILRPPLHQYKVDILTNNASTFAQVVYKKYDQNVPIRILFQELYATAEISSKMHWHQRTSSLLYCIGQLSTNLKNELEDYITMFIRDVIMQIEQKSKFILQGDAKSAESFAHCLLSLEMLQYFLENTSEEYQQFNMEIIPKVVPFLFLKNQYLSQKQHETLIHVSNKIINDVNNNLNQQIHLENMRTVHTCFFNRSEEAIPGLNEADGEGVKPYVAMIIDTIVYGKEELFGQCIDFVQLLLREVTGDNLQIYILKIVGALIRVLNYKISLDMKVQALRTIELCQHIDLSQFRPQLIVTYDKIVVEMNKIPKGLKQLSRNYATCIISHPKRDYLLNQIFNRAISGETQEIRECYLKVTKKILKEQHPIKDQVFSSALLERIFVLSRQFFDKSINRHASIEFAQLGLILAITYQYTSKANKDQYVQKYLLLQNNNLLLRLQFHRYNDLAIEESQQAVIKEVNSLKEIGQAVQIIHIIRKLKWDLKSQLKPHNADSEQLLQAMFRI